MASYDDFNCWVCTLGQNQVLRHRIVHFSHKFGSERVSERTKERYEQTSKPTGQYFSPNSCLFCPTVIWGDDRGNCHNSGFLGFDIVARDKVLFMICKVSDNFRRCGGSDGGNKFDRVQTSDAFWRCDRVIVSK